MAFRLLPRRKPRTRRQKAADAAHRAGRIARNPLVTMLLADLAVRGGKMAVRYAVRRGMLQSTAQEPAEGAQPQPRHPLRDRVVTAAATTIATRSVPGAVFVGTGLLAHTLYVRGRQKRAARLAAEQEHQQAEHLRDATGVGGTLPPT